VDSLSIYEPTAEELEAANDADSIPEIPVPVPKSQESVQDLEARMAMYRKTAKDFIYCMAVSDGQAFQRFRS